MEQVDFQLQKNFKILHKDWPSHFIMGVNMYFENRKPC